MSTLISLNFHSIGADKSPFPIPQMQSVFDPHAQRNAFLHHDARQQSRSSAPYTSKADTAPSPSGFAEIIRGDFPVLRAVNCATRSDSRLKGRSSTTDRRTYR